MLIYWFFIISLTMKSLINKLLKINKMSNFYHEIAESLLNLKESQKLYFCNSWKGIRIDKGRGYGPVTITDYRDINDLFKSDCNNYAIKNAFNRANKFPLQTKINIEQLTNNKIEVIIEEDLPRYIIK